MAKNDAPPSFAELIEQAQRMPETGSLGTDVSSPFPLPIPAEHQVVDLDDPEKVPGVPKYNYEAHVVHYTLPADCRAYEITLNEILNGHAVLRYEDRHFNKESDCIVVISYLTYVPPPARNEDEDEDEERRRQRGN